MTSWLLFCGVLSMHRCIRGGSKDWNWKNAANSAYATLCTKFGSRNMELQRIPNVYVPLWDSWNSELLKMGWNLTAAMDLQRLWSSEPWLSATNWSQRRKVSLSGPLLSHRVFQKRPLLKKNLKNCPGPFAWLDQAHSRFLPTFKNQCHFGALKKPCNNKLESAAGPGRLPDGETFLKRRNWQHSSRVTLTWTIATTFEDVLTFRVGSSRARLPSYYSLWVSAFNCVIFGFSFFIHRSPLVWFVVALTATLLF